MWWSNKRLGEEVDAQRARFANLPEDLKKERFEEEAQAGWAKIEQCVAAFRAGSNILQGGRFDTLSLGTWMEIVKAADLTYVPAELVHLASGRDVLASQFAPIPLDIPDEALKYRGMVRMDECGSLALKARQGVRGLEVPDGPIVGAVMHEGKWHFAFDNRTLTGFLTYVGQINSDGDTQLPIWWRPWVKAVGIEVPRPKFMAMGPDKWPLEWRVIVHDGKMVAISSYYVQAPVTRTTQIDGYLSAVCTETEKLLAFMREKNIQPWHPRYIGERREDEVSFSLDFIQTTHGPAFLEAGPAVPMDENRVPVEDWGAHPCNFMGRRVEGVALSKTGLFPISDVCHWS